MIDGELQALPVDLKREKVLRRRRRVYECVELPYWRFEISGVRGVRRKVRIDDSDGGGVEFAQLLRVKVQPSDLTVHFGFEGVRISAAVAVVAIVESKTVLGVAVVCFGLQNVFVLFQSLFVMVLTKSKEEKRRR